MADPGTAKQLLAGFYGPVDTWRWTGPTFVIALRPPETSQPVQLDVKLYFPPSQIEELGPVTMQAETEEFTFRSVIFEHGGAGEYKADIPARALCTNLLPVTFKLDKFAPASERDGRDLGVVVSFIGLVPRR